MRQTKRKNKVIFIIITVLIVGFIISSHKNSAGVKSSDKGGKMTVSTTTVKIKKIQDKIKLTGTVLPEEEVRIAPKASGNIVSIFADSGEYVKAGQVLAKTDDSNLIISKQSAQAQLMEALASSQIAFNKSRKQDITGAKESELLSKSGIDVARSALKIAEVNLKKAQKDKERYYGLYTQGAISAIDYDSASTNCEIAESQYNRAQADLVRAEADYNRTKSTSSLTYEGSRVEDKEIAAARVQQARANLSSIQKEIEDCYIKAPISGYIVKRNIKLGSRVSSEDVAFILVKNNILELQAEAAEADIYKLKAGQSVFITSGINPDLKITGKIKKIEPYINPDTRIGSVKISLPQDKRINYGMFLDGSVLLSDSEKTVIPEDALLFRNNKNIVFKVSNNIVHETEVQPGTRNSNNVEIITGLDSGDVIVLDGAGFLFDGDTVKIR